MTGTDDQDGGAVDAFLDSIPDPEQRADCRDVASMMAEVAGSRGHIANVNVVGFGQVHYRYASGREGDTFKIGFARRTRRLTLYLLSGLVGYDDLLDRLGAHVRAKSCIHIRRLADVDRAVLRQLLTRGVRHLDRTVGERGAIPRMSEMPRWTEPDPA